MQHVYAPLSSYLHFFTVFTCVWRSEGDVNSKCECLIAPLTPPPTQTQHVPNQIPCHLPQPSSLMLPMLVTKWQQPKSYRVSLFLFYSLKPFIPKGCQFYLKRLRLCLATSFLVQATPSLPSLVFLPSLPACLCLDVLAWQLPSWSFKSHKLAHSIPRLRLSPGFPLYSR